MMFMNFSLIVLLYLYVVSHMALAQFDDIPEELLSIFSKNDSQRTESVTSSTNNLTLVYHLPTSNSSERFYEYFDKLTNDYDNKEPLPKYSTDKATFVDNIETLQGKEPAIENLNEISALKINDKHFTEPETLSRKLDPLVLDISIENNNDKINYFKTTSDTTAVENDNISYKVTKNEYIQQLIYPDAIPFTRLKLIITTASKSPYRPRIIGEDKSEKVKKVPEFLNIHNKQNGSESTLRRQKTKLQINNMTATNTNTDQSKFNAFYNDQGKYVQKIFEMPTESFSNDTKQTTTPVIESNNNHDIENRNHYLYSDMLSKSKRKFSMLNFDSPNAILEYFEESYNHTDNNEEPHNQHAENGSDGGAYFTIKSNYVTPNSYDTFSNMDDVKNIKEPASDARSKKTIEKSYSKQNSQNGNDRFDIYPGIQFRRNYNMPGSFDTMAKNLDAMANNLEDMAENFDKSPENYNSNPDDEPSNRYTYFNKVNSLPEFITKQFTFATKSNSIVSAYNFAIHDFVGFPNENLNKNSDTTTHSFIDDLFKDIDAHLDNAQNHTSFDKALYPSENIKNEYDIQSEVPKYVTSTPEVLDIDYFWKDLNERTSKMEDFTADTGKISDPIHIRPFISLEDEIKGRRTALRKRTKMHEDLTLSKMFKKPEKSFILVSGNADNSNNNITQIKNEIAATSLNSTRWEVNNLKPFVYNESKYGTLKVKRDNSLPELYDILNDEPDGTPIQNNKLAGNPMEINQNFLGVDTVNENDKVAIVGNSKGSSTADSRDVVISQNFPTRKLTQIKSFLSDIRPRNGLKMGDNDYEGVTASILPVVDEKQKNFEKFPVKSVNQNNDAYNAADTFFTFARKRTPSKQNIHSILGKLK